jgi:hypothetical protein
VAAETFGAWTSGGKAEARTELGTAAAAVTFGMVLAAVIAAAAANSLRRSELALLVLGISFASA